MSKYLEKYDKHEYRSVGSRVTELIEKYPDGPFENVIYADQGNEKGLEEYLGVKHKYDDWNISADEWHEYVEYRLDSLKNLYTYDEDPGSIIKNYVKDENLELAIGDNSIWVHYIQNLRKKKGFTDDSIEELEKATQRILKRLSLSTSPDEPVKGLVLGNVQSGKTANMMGLMCAAADKGFNLFIILSGTIENLRKQTSDRMKLDLATNTPKTFEVIEEISKKTITNLNLQKRNQSVYFMVCLKNSTRLKNLLKWLNDDKNMRERLKVVVIDDEADQASINTRDIDKDERTKINSQILSLVYNKNQNCKPAKSNFACMNYICYTATPYANMLNEAPSKNGSLYPSNFISTLKSAKEYFGPLQIFGDEDHDGLNIVNSISSAELDLIKDANKNEFGDYRSLIGLTNSILWFYCAAACFRKWNLKKPVSMLIHTSIRVQAHDSINSIVEACIGDYRNNIEKFYIDCLKVWKDQTNLFTKDDLLNGMPVMAGKVVNNYPDFDDIKPFLKELISKKPEHIKFTSERKLKFGEAVHICVDDGSNNPSYKDDDFLRLAYPKKNDVDYSTAFIVIGGATLSRGLTIEGLVSTYFLRTTSLADALMQMGRWFGYRNNYELLPRLWLSNDTILQFEDLALIDKMLRRTIREMQIAGKSPSDCATPIRNVNERVFKALTSSSKMQDSIYNKKMSDSFYQVTSYTNDASKIKNNLDNLEKLISSADKQNKFHIQRNNLVWNSIDNNTIIDFLDRYEMPDFIDLKIDLELIKSDLGKLSTEKKLKKWNLVLVSLNKSIERKVAGHPINLVNRARTIDDSDNILRIKTLRNKDDLLSDLDSEVIEKIKSGRINENIIKKIRNENGLEYTPTLYIYVINHESMPLKCNSKKVPLKAKDDLVGVCLFLPNTTFDENVGIGQLCIDLNKHSRTEVEGE